MVYQYLAYNEGGQVVKGKLTASTEETATELLNYAGYRAISLRPYAPFLSLDKLLVSLSQVKPPEVIIFYHPCLGIAPVICDIMPKKMTGRN